MALKVTDALGSNRDLKTSVLTDEHTPHHHVDSSALPNGAATESTLSTIDTDTGNIATSTSAIADAVAGTEMQVDLVSLGGAATEGKQDIGNNSLSSIDGKVATQTTLASIDGKVATQTTLNALNNKVTTVNTSDVTVGSSVLPTDAATSGNQITTNLLLGTIDTDTGALVNCIDGVGGTELKVDLIDLGGAATESTLSTLSGNVTTLSGNVSTCDTDDVTVSSSALPTNAATDALQTAGNASLDTLADCADPAQAKQLQVDLVDIGGAATEATLSTLSGNVTTCDTDDVGVTSVAIPTTLYSFAVTSAAVATQLTSSSTPITSGVTVKALSTNTDLVYVGPSGVTTIGTPATCGIELSAGEPQFIEIDNLDQIYIIAVVSGEGVTIIAS